MSNKRHKPEEIVTKLRQVEVLVGQGMARTNRPHIALGYRPPAPEAIVPMDQRPVMH